MVSKQHKIEAKINMFQMVAEGNSKCLALISRVWEEVKWLYADDTTINHMSSVFNMTLHLWLNIKPRTFFFLYH